MVRLHGEVVHGQAGVGFLLAAAAAAAEPAGSRLPAARELRYTFGARRPAPDQAGHTDRLLDGKTVTTAP